MNRSDSSPPPSAGEQLRLARLQQNHTLEEAAAHTRISLANLRAIEEGALDRLPAAAFTKGLVANYAAYLEMDTDTVATQFLAEYAKTAGRRPESLPAHQAVHNLEPKKLAEQPRVSSAAAAAVLLVCIVTSFSGFCVYYSWNPFAYLTDKLLTLTQSVADNFHPADPATSSLRTQNVLLLQAVFHADCRVQVRLDNQPPMEQTYLKGSTIQWEAQHSMHLDFMGENCAELQFNGSLLPFPPFREGKASLQFPTAVHGP
nr:helix-turn-helix domain-containing protein [uncultured Desulfobulbus sp.]